MTKDLIERLEAATGLDRALDRAIWCELEFDSRGEPSLCPTYTASLDASLTLVGEKLPGWAWSVGNKLYGGQAYLMCAPGGEMISGAGATPALALLIALLEALETK